jgi:hypothetical protein
MNQGLKNAFVAAGIAHHGVNAETPRYEALEKIVGDLTKNPEVKTEPYTLQFRGQNLVRDI